MKLLDRRLPLVVVAVALLAPASAAATWKVAGHGFGHGVGLSQYGAYGYAQHGRDYREIVGHYFTHTKLGRAGGAVRVLLGSGEGAVGFRGAGRGCGKRLNPGARYSFAVESGRVVLSRSGRGASPCAAQRARRRAGFGSTASGAIAAASSPATPAARCR